VHLQIFSRHPRLVVVRRWWLPDESDESSTGIGLFLPVAAFAFCAFSLAFSLTMYSALNLFSACAAWTRLASYMAVVVVMRSICSQSAELKPIDGMSTPSP